MCFIIAFVAVVVVGQRNAASGCASNVACFPWETRAGPFCGRGNKMNLRFAIDVAPENVYQPDYYGFKRTTQMTYAFCPRVDELQAFNLTDAIGYMALDRTNSSNATISRTVYESYLSVVGFGEIGNIYTPGNTSFGRVLIVDNRTNKCPIGQVGVVNFLVLNITMDKGRFKYYPNVSEHPQSVGFLPSCDSTSVCMYDTESHCIGPEGLQNCARCYSDPQELQGMPLQIWASYYGTDFNGRLMRSGANNPLNFRAFSGSGVYSRLTSSVDRLRSGKTAEDDQLEP